MRRFWIFLLCVLLLVTPVSAASEISLLQNSATVASDGSCQVSLSVTLQLDSAMTDPVFPLPANASSVSLNGRSVSARKSGSVRQVDLSKFLGGAGTYQLNFHYTLQRTVRHDEDGKLMLELPLLSGFAYPISKMEFVIALPGTVENRPTFSSGYLRESIESHLTYTTVGSSISGLVTSQLEDHETLTMTLEVPQDQFPTTRVRTTTWLATDILAIVCACLALLYWLLTLGCLPQRPIHQPTPPEGLSAGQLGSYLTGVGSDLTLMVLTWAQLGYLFIQMDDSGRVLLHKRMDMGNERSSFELRVFRSLFGAKRMVDGSGYHYAQLCRKVARSSRKVPGLYRRNSGNPMLFRVLAAGVGLFCGISMAIHWTETSFWQITLALLLGTFGIISCLLIQLGCRHLHLHDRRHRRLCLILCGVWLFLGLVQGSLGVAIGVVCSQLLAGLAAAYGGKRSDLGKQSLQHILGLRRYLRSVPREQLQHIVQTNPDYFYAMAPYALALGVEKQFARRFGDLNLPECSYLAAGISTRLSPTEWMGLLQDVAEALDERQRQLFWEKLMGK